MTLTLKQFAVAYATTAAIFLALDAIWLSTMAERLYRPALGGLMADQPAWAPAAAFYVIYVAGVVLFAVAPALARASWGSALGWGALLGFVAYATYDLTNQATLRDWPWKVTLADLCWGSFVTGVSAAAACRLTGWLAPSAR